MLKSKTNIRRGNHYKTGALSHFGLEGVLEEWSPGTGSSIMKQIGVSET